eukprot:7390377-Prymnesium_polylepis.1
MVILHEVLGDESREVAQLHAWTALAHTYGAQWEAALGAIGKAMLLVERAFEVRDRKGRLQRAGNRSWEYWRLKHDLVYVLKHAAEASAEGTLTVGQTKLGATVHTSFSGAEREEVQANELRKELVRDSVRDDATSMSGSSCRDCARSCAARSGRRRSARSGSRRRARRCRARARTTTWPRGRRRA